MLGRRTRTGTGYPALGTDRYSPFTLADVADYPARLDVVPLWAGRPPGQRQPTRRMGASLGISQKVSLWDLGCRAFRLGWLMITRTRASRALLTYGLGRLRIASLAESQRSMPYEHGRLPGRTDHDTLSRSAEPPYPASR